MLWCPIQTTHRKRTGRERWHVLPKWLTLPFYSVLKHLLEPRSHLTTGMAVLVSVFPQTQKCLHYTALLISRVTEKGPTGDSLGITNCYMASPSTKRPTLPPSQLLSYFKTLALCYSLAYCLGLGGPLKLTTETAQHKVWSRQVHLLVLLLLLAIQVYGSYDLVSSRPVQLKYLAPWFF